MSSSNEVAIYALEETTAYGVVEAAGNFSTVRQNGETLDGTPDVKKNDEIRNDRQSAGQKVVGLQVGGNVKNGMLRDAINDQFMGGALYNNVQVAALMGADVATIDATAKTITFATEDPSATLSVKDFCTLSGFSNAENNTTVYVASVTGSVITYLGGGLMTDEIGSGDEVATRPPYLEIGSVKRSWSLEKHFGDLTNKFIDYTGMRVAQMGIEMSFGDYARLSFDFAGNGYGPIPTTPITDSRTIDPPSSNDPLNASSDVGLVLVNGAEAECGFSSLSIDLNNNMQASNKLGKIEPCDQTGFEATVNVKATMELTDTNTDYVKNKLDQTPIEFATFATDENGLGYGVQVYAAQLSFSDPSSSGGNQFVQMDMSGVAKVDSVLNKTMRIYLMGTI